MKAATREAAGASAEHLKLILHLHTSTFMTSLRHSFLSGSLVLSPASLALSPASLVLSPASLLTCL